MRIGILGSGLMAEALGGQWGRAGHDVLIGGRSPEKSAALAKGIGASSGTLRETAAFGDVTLLAISADGVEQTLRSIDAPGGSLAGRPLIDCTNAVVPGDFTLAVPAMAELVASLAADAQVVKAFNLAPDTVWRDAQHGMVRQGGDFEGGPLGVPLCGDDAAAVARVGVLVRDLGCEPVHAGGLARARLLEATAAFAIGVWATGGDARSLFPTLARAFGSVEP
jgi:predicted dinucleotide-binding enzyme